MTGSAAVITPSGAGWLIVGPSGSPLGTTATINLPKGDIRANGFTSRAGAGGTLGMVFRGRPGHRRTSCSTSRATSADRSRWPVSMTGGGRSGRFGSAAARRYTGPAMSTPRRRAATSIVRPAPISGDSRAEAAALPLGHPPVQVVLPTYNEAENIRSIAAAILEALPGAALLVVDDGSPDGAGRSPTSWRLSTCASRSVTARPSRGSAGPTLTASASPSTAAPSSWSRWTPTGRDPAVLPALIAPIVAGDADLVIGSRYTPAAASSTGAWAGG